MLDVQTMRRRSRQTSIGTARSLLTSVAGENVGRVANLVVGPVLALLVYQVEKFFDHGLLDLSPVIEVIKKEPWRLVTPIDVAFEVLRPHHFKNTRFDGVQGDPGWFGPDSAMWYVHSHGTCLMLGILNTAVADIVHQGIQAAVFEHSKLPGRDLDGNVVPGTFSTTGAPIRGGQTMAFFAGVALADSHTAESLARTVNAIHSKVKGIGSDGTPYDANEPEFFRWGYATVVDGLAAAHRRYHPKPLKGAALDRFYREYAVVGEALGGVNLPKTAAECREILNNAPSAAGVGLNDGNIAYFALTRNPMLRMWPFRYTYDLAYWLMVDMQSDVVKKAMGYKPGSRRSRWARRRLLYVLVRLAEGNGKGIEEVRKAYRRVGRTPVNPYSPRLSQPMYRDISSTGASCQPT
ncbi:oxygenase MpaB family protein [Mycobacteroides saopaulense]|uniref:ER-bound oxygenase mpaB/mpaB'/Rubber oxygenase catalytic domain-containing protein n=1 Tax=Mycobacteroides saopaulense TaxID=1578165 RepID=A0ABX3BZ24_9MYCO|nr:oxygenase MpaB family protein [Mycobacteroides saopaulense]OHT81498.1 hypothetical protein BKG68_21340 [Mycobacteroides saopaulense]OHU09026.1 hypothetical protein BKG73_13300 [Mycobacteroides saopaulense]